MGALKELGKQLLDYPVALGSLAALAYGAFSWIPTAFFPEKIAQNPEKQTTDMLASLALFAAGWLGGKFYKKYFGKSDCYDPAGFSKYKPSKIKITELKSHPVRDMRDYFSSYYEALAPQGNLAGRIAKRKKQLEKDPSYCNARLSLIEAYANNGELKKACIESSKLAGLVQSGETKPLARGICALKYFLNKDSLAHNFISANINLAMASYANAIEKFNKLAALGKPDINIAIARALSAIPDQGYAGYCEKRSQELWEESTEKIAPELTKQDRIGESKAYVMKENEFLEDCIVFKANSKRQALEREAANAKKIEEVLADCSSWFAPKPHYITKKAVPIGGEQLYFYAMEREPGKTLLEMILDGCDKAKLSRHFDDSTRMLATVHLRAGYSTEIYHIFRSLHLKKLRDPALEIPEKLKTKILACSEPIVASMMSAKLVQDCDAHPGNVQVDARNYETLLDTERNQLVPQPIEVAKHLCYLDKEQQDEKVNCYVNTYGSGLLEPEFRLGYLNALIHTAFSQSLSWSSEHRASEQTRQLRPMLATSAVEAISRIEKEFGLYYKFYRQEYSGLEDSVLELNEHLMNV
jgi:hypothetical protein